MIAIVADFTRKVIKIFSEKYPYNRFKLLYDYTRLLAKSVAHHKLKKSHSNVLQFTFLGLKIQFFSYPQLLALVEEIFIYQEYKFKSPDTKPFIIDGGSNIGLSVLYFKKLYPESVIIGFEPDQLSFETLQKNLKDNNITGVTVYNIALSKEADKKTLYSNKASTAFMTMSLYASGGDDGLQLVSVEKLSDHITRPVSFMKLDVEGSETAIIDDLMDHQRLTYINEMVIECHPHINHTPVNEITRRLQASDFVCNERRNLRKSNPKSRIIHIIRKQHTTML